MSLAVTMMNLGQINPWAQPPTPTATVAGAREWAFLFLDAVAFVWDPLSQQTHPWAKRSRPQKSENRRLPRQAGRLEAFALAL